MQSNKNRNRKSIQILRGSKRYDPKISTTILLDGQPFYSKKTKEFFIGDGESQLKDLKGTPIGLDLNEWIRDYFNSGVFTIIFDGGDANFKLAKLDSTILE